METLSRKKYVITMEKREIFLLQNILSYFKLKGVIHFLFSLA